MIQTYTKGKNISVMVWACFGGDGRKSQLLFCPGDPDSKKGGVTAAVHLEILEEELPTLWELGLISMQDNAPIHKAYIIRDWFIEQGINAVDWPPYPRPEPDRARWEAPQRMGP